MPKSATGMDLQWRTHQLAVGRDPLALSEREWMLGNGTGSFSMGTAAGINTRRYHGLLVACESPPVGRVVALNQMLEQLFVSTGNRQVALEFAACLFRDDRKHEVVAPDGNTLLRRFDKGLSVSWHYASGQITFVRELYLHWKQQAATLRYLIDGLDNADTATLNLRPMLTLRNFHGLLNKNEAGPIAVDVKNATVTVRRAQTAATIQCDHGQFMNHSDWWYNIFYPLDAERGQESQEDYFTPGFFEIDLDTTQPVAVTLTIALGAKPVESSAWSSKLRQHHLTRVLEHLGNDTPASGAPIKRIFAIAADDFVVDRTVGEEKYSTIMAGYPWFADWGRDTFVALPGLLLETGRFDEAKATLHTFAQAIRKGLVPNRFDDYQQGSAHYNTVDASLWFVHSAIHYVEYSSDIASWNQWLSSAVKQVLDAYIHGTEYDIKVTGDGLISAGSADTQLTWMDAAHSSQVFTPRQGKAVEINALWYNALAGTAPLFAATEKRAADHYDKLARRIKRSFVKVFWDDQRGYLRDHVWSTDGGQDHIDAALRPNQIFAVSLPRSALPRTKQQKLLKQVEEKLLTPYGLRTLPPDDPNYHGHYGGSQFDRDAAYHQGTVWPWLIGAYAEGVLRVGRFKPEAKAEACSVIAPVLAMLAGKGPFASLGQLHEIHEGDPPHRPVGCIAQAWSVAEVLRVQNLIERH